MTPRAHLICLKGIFWREGLRFFHQRERFIAALVRPLVWLLVFAVGLRAALEFTVAPPYEAAISYETYVVPGLIAMVQLFNGMQSSLSLVYDREMGSMKILLTSPLPRWYLLLCKLLAGSAVSILQVYAFLLVAYLYGVEIPPWGALAVLPVLVLTGLLLGSIGLVLSSVIRQLENFAGVMNFVIFPAFFLSSALYPLTKMRESSAALYHISLLNPFTHAVEALRYALHLKLDVAALAWTLIWLALFFAVAILAYDPKRGIIRRRGS